MAANTSVAKELADVIAQCGARVCFGVLGTANFPITYALAKNGVKYIPAMHEANAVMMACGYARTRQELVVASLHSGPGLTNALTAIAEASKSKTPLLVIAGDVAAGDIRNNFYFDQTSMVRSVGAIAERIYTPDTAVADLLRSLRRVLRDQQTVVLTIPEDVQKALFHDKAETESVNSLTKHVLSPLRTVPDPATIKVLAEAVEQSKRPLILAGRGAIVANAKDSLQTLGGQIGALFATSLAAHGVFAGEEWTVGISGGFASDAALELLPQSDLILGFGASFTHWTTRRGHLLNPAATIVQIDCDQSRLGYNRAASFEVLGDADLTAQALHRELLERGVQNRAAWRTDETRSIISALGSHRLPAGTKDGPDYIDPRRLTVEIDRILPKDRVVVTDAGHFSGWPALYLAPPDERGWCMPTSFQSVGVAMGCAIGAGLAQPERITVLAIGDGGLMMSMSDFATAISSGLRMCVIVYNDSAYGAEVHYFESRGYSTDIVKFTCSDFAAIAKGYGAEAAVVRNTEDLSALTHWVQRGAPGLFLVDARVDPTVMAEWFQDAFSEKPEKDQHN